MKRPNSEQFSPFDCVLNVDITFWPAPLFLLIIINSQAFGRRLRCAIPPDAGIIQIGKTPTAPSQFCCAQKKRDSGAAAGVSNSSWPTNVSN